MRVAKHTGYLSTVAVERIGGIMAEHRTQVRTWQLQPDALYTFHEKVVSTRVFEDVYLLTTENVAHVLTREECEQERAKRWPKESTDAALERAEQWAFERPLYEANDRRMQET